MKKILVIGHGTPSIITELLKKNLSTDYEVIHQPLGDKITGAEIDYLVFDDLIKTTKAPSGDDFKDLLTHIDPLECHKGKGDPNGLRQQFTMNKRKFK